MRLRLHDAGVVVIRLPNLDDLRPIAIKRKWKFDPRTQEWLVAWADEAQYVLGRHPEFATVFQNQRAEEENRYHASHATKGDMIVGAEALYPYQNASVMHALDVPRRLDASDMGLGKTAVAVAVCNVVCAEFSTVLIVCPASLKINWQREWFRWTNLKLPVTIIHGSHRGPTPLTEGVVIINYDILHKHRYLLEREWDVLILDECHYLKNPKAVRTKLIFGGAISAGRDENGDKIMAERVKPLKAKRVMALSGTPMTNRPEELYNILHYLDPIAWPDRMRFAWRYCNARKGPWGWDTSGASHLDELQRKMRSSVMFRLKKSEVDIQLPAKTHQVIEFEAGASAEEERGFFSKILEKYGVRPGKRTSEGEFQAVLKELKLAAVDTTRLAEIRQETALEKLPFVIEHVQNLLDHGEKVVLFAWHREVIRRLREAFPNGLSVVITGETPLRQRQDNVDAFQSCGTAGHASPPLFIGNIKAAGVGLTLHAARVCVFAELSFVPADMEQASDRLHRIGQKRNVLVQYLVQEGGIDAWIANMLARKARVCDLTLNRKEEWL